MRVTKTGCVSPARRRLAAWRFPSGVFSYGGSWNKGEREEYKFVGEALAAKGMVVALADYRLYPEVRYPAFLEDGARAVAWMRREARRAALRCHSGKMFVMGLSRSQLAGWIALAGPYDFLPSNNPDVQPVFHHPDYPRGAEPNEHISKAAPRTFRVEPTTSGKGYSS